MAHSIHSGNSLSSGAETQLEDQVERFEMAWQRGESPVIDAYLPAESHLRLPTLIELVHADLEYRLKVHEPVRIENYLNRYPELLEDPGILEELIRAEYRLRRAHDPGVNAEEYRRRFPGYRAAEVEDEHPVPTIPGYELLEVIGRGGMGIVYRARQLRPPRLVALKMVRSSHPSEPRERARFQTEATAIARLQHPNIVQIHAVGEHQGQCYLTLEFLTGGSLDRKLAGQPQPPRLAAQFVAVLARAMHFAHQRGIIHRDLKPANILLAVGDRPSAIGPEGPLDGASCLLNAVPKITDFGLARLLEDTGLSHAGIPEPGARTQTGAILGTPCYMAPEQAVGQTQAPGPAVDIYALGVILYELLTGRPPFREPTALATLERVRFHPVPPPRRLQRRIPRDLETICLKALEKDPTRRYPTAAALAEDLERFLNGQPIQARRMGLPERLVRWCGRNLAMAGMLLVMALLGTALAGVTWLWRESDRQRRQADDAATRDVQVLSSQFRDLTCVAWDPAGQRVVAGNREGVLIVWDIATGREVLSFSGHTSRVTGLAFFPDGSRFASGGDDRVVRVWDTSTGQRLLSLPGHKSWITSVACSPDGRWLASGSFDETVKRWDVQTGLAKETWTGHQGSVTAVAFSPDGRWLASASRDRTARLWPIDEPGEPIQLVGHAGWVTGLAFSADGQVLATSGEDRTVRLWQLPGGQALAVLRAHTAEVRALAFGSAGRRLASIGADHTVNVWEGNTREPALVFRRPKLNLVQLAFSPDDTHLAVAEDRSVRVWDVAPR